MVSAGEQKSQVVCFAQVDGALENDLILVAVKRSCAQAKRVGAHIVVFEIDTPGGRLDVMQEICAQIEKLAPAKTVAYIRGGPSGGAFSAGAVLAVACDEIYMAPGTAIGAAAPVIVGKKKVNPVAQKAVSAIAARMRSLAEKNGHPPKIAGAMVDADIELRETNVGGRQTFLSIDKAAQTEPQGQVELGDWITTKGKLLTLTAAEATRLGFAAGLVSSRRELLAALGLHSGRMKDLGTSEALKEALARRRRYLVKLNGQIAAYEAKAKALDPAQFRYRRLKERVGFHEPGDFEDEGRLWRQRSDACVRALDACLAACRQKLVLARKYPEMKIDAKPVESKMSELLMLRERVAAQRNMGGSES
jgi:ATP-dependent protease ClpP protease subunit